LGGGMGMVMGMGVDGLGHLLGQVNDIGGVIHCLFSYGFCNLVNNYILYNLANYFNNFFRHLFSK